MRIGSGARLAAVATLLVLAGCGGLDRKPEFGPAPAADARPDPSPTVDPASPASDSDPAKEADPSGGWWPFADTKPNAPVSINLHVFGLSYHPDRQGVRDNHLNNELNLGLGFNYEFHNDDRGVAGTEAGLYLDSGRNWAKFAGIGYQFKLREGWKLGADLLLVDSRTYNHGRLFIAPIPRLIVDIGHAKLNAIYIPKFREHSRFEVFAIYFTIPLKTW